MALCGTIPPMNPAPRLRQVIADRLRELMAARPDLDTQVKLARRAGLSQSTVNRILSCDASATVDSIASLARALGASPALLLMSDATEIGLLLATQSLKPDDRQRLLGYAQGMSSTHRTTTEGVQFSLDSSVAVSPSRRAAHAKAVARPIKAPTTQEGNAVHAKKRTPAR